MLRRQLRQLRSRIRRARWKLVKVFDNRAYLKHIIDMDPDGNDWEAREEYLYWETKHWMKRADRVHVGVTEIPLGDADGHWLTTSDGFRCLGWEPLRQFKKLVEDREYEFSRRRFEGRELRIKWFTAFVAAIAAAASILNVYLTYGKK